MPEIAGNETAQSANCPQDAIFHHHADCHHQCAIRIVHRIISLIGMLTSCPARGEIIIIIIKIIIEKKLLLIIIIGMLTSCPARGETADWNADRSRPRALTYMCTFSTLLAQHIRCDSKSINNGTLYNRVLKSAHARVLEVEEALEPQVEVQEVFLRCRRYRRPTKVSLSLIKSSTMFQYVSKHLKALPSSLL